jgi:hypothetical protein
LGQEDVDDKVPIIQKYPFGIVVPFDADWKLTPILLHSHINLIADGLVLTDVSTGADQEEVGEACYVSQIEDDSILRLLGKGGSDGSMPIRISSFWGLVRWALTRDLLG